MNVSEPVSPVSYLLPMPLKIVRNLFHVLVALLFGTTVLAAAPADDEAAVAPVKGLCDSLVASMKRGTELDFAGRVGLLGPEIQRDLNLPFMTRIVVGPSWKTFSPADQEGLVKAFSDYSIGTYAQRFKSYSGERFEVDPVPAAVPNGDRIVHTKLFTGGPTPVQLDYLVRKSDEGWKVIDVFLSGTISEIAARRSEYSTVLRQGGAQALIQLLQKKTAEFGH
jgi:phospholipid transport system substrate-binding protein